MNKYYALQRDFRSTDMSIYELKSENEDEAWEEIENDISSNMSQEWLLSEDELRQLKDKLNGVKQ